MVREVDLRSDTVTKPTAAMRKAMAEAVVGDDVYSEDPTVNELQERIAKFLGKEAALFVPSGTMGNLTAVMAHCWTRGQEIIIGDESHMFMYEQGGISQLASVHVSSIPTLEDGTFDLEVLKEKIRPKFPNIHEPSTGLICIENSHNRCGGRVLPMSFIREVNFLFLLCIRNILRCSSWRDICTLKFNCVNIFTLILSVAFPLHWVFHD
ncbi:UNVERIFIED_CONTAM: low-specificity L-threonine aldolase 2, partial [Trichonephila clavipes]